MIFQARTTIFILGFFALFLGTSCVSVNLKPKGPAKSNTYSFQAPSDGFQKIEDAGADIAFQHQQSGHTIAMMSECSETRDPDLQTLENEITSAISEIEQKKTQTFDYNGRQAIRSLYDGKMDGVPVSIETLIFKKNACAYTMTLLGRRKGFFNRQAEFQKFIDGFKVP